MATGKVFKDGKQVGTVNTEDPNFQYQQAKSAAAQQFGSWSPEYAEEYKRKQMERFGREVSAARDMYESALGGETSQALAAQRLGLGQSAAQQAAMASANNPLAARAAQYGGAQQAMNLVQQAAGQRAQEVAQARDALLGSQLQQMGYAGQLEALDFARRKAQEQAQRKYAERELADRMRMLAENEAQANAIRGGFASLIPFAGDLIESGLK